MNLYKASNQWANRPVDETFWDIDDALVEAQNIKRSAALATSNYSSLRFESDGDALKLLGENNKEAIPTYSATGQLCQRARVPHSLIARQPAELAATNLNWGLREYRDEEDEASLLFHNNGQLVLRAATSKWYERLWNADFLACLADNLNGTWRTPPAYPSPARMDDPRIRFATAEDLEGIEGLTRVKVGDKIAPAGVYMSDKDLFVFVISKNTINGPSGPLNRFAFFFNNEIGTGSWGVTCGYFDVICGNHIVWGASGVREMKVRHVGENSITKGIQKMKVTLNEYEDGSAMDDELKLKRAATYEIAATKDDVLNAVFAFGKKVRIPELSMKRIEAAYDRAEQVDRYGSPRTAWALSSGLTELSQESPYADERNAIDRAAGRVLEIAF